MSFDKEYERISELEAENERLRHPFRAVDNEDWSYLLGPALGHGGRDKFWRSVLTEMREALTQG